MFISFDIEFYCLILTLTLNMMIYFSFIISNSLPLALVLTSTQALKFASLDLHFYLDLSVDVGLDVSIDLDLEVFIDLKLDHYFDYDLDSDLIMTII